MAKKHGSGTKAKVRASVARPGPDDEPSSPPAWRPALKYRLTPTRSPIRRQLWPAAVPGLHILAGYRRAWLRPDLFAGVSVAAYLIPQVMAYAAIVRLPPVAGLWTALAALAAYSVLGGSRVLSPGPESTVALMAGAAIAPLAAGDPQRALALSATLSLVVAGWLVIARLARLGVVSDLLSQPLLVGYLAGGAVLMVTGQLGTLTRVTVTGDTLLAQWGSFVANVGGTHPATLAVGAGTLALVLFVRWWRPTWPGPLIAVVIATVTCAVTGLADAGVSVVGALPAESLAPRLPTLTAADVRALAMAGLGVAVVAYGDITLIGRAFPGPADPGRATPAAVDPQQELVALAGVHVASGLVGGFPVSASGSRTALAIAAGARTQAYSLVAAACVVGVLVAAGPLIADLPQASLAAVVCYAAGTLVSWREVVRLARFRSSEVLLALAALLGTVIFGILAGVGIAIALSLLEMAQRLARPHEGVLGRVPGVPGMHDVDDYPEAQTLPGLVIYRYDAPLFFANAADLRRRALLVVDQENDARPDEPVRWFVLNVEANVEVDITAADALADLAADLDARGVRLGLARAKRDLLLPLRRSGLIDLIGEDMVFPTLPVTQEAYLARRTTPTGDHPNGPANGDHPVP